MKNVNEKSLTNLRMLGLDQIVNSATGHPGMVLSAAPLMHEIYLNHIFSDVDNYEWINRDRFILSAGHGSALLYSQLYLAGYKIEISDLKNFRQIGSITPGHPELHVTPGVDASTGPLGQGFAMSVGVAMAEKHLAAKYNLGKYKVFDHFTYVICGDADLEEGVCQEAIQIAGVNQLEKLIVLYDSNDIQLDTKVDKVQTKKFKKYFESNNWEYILIENGNDLVAINDAINKAKKSNKPSLIECKTIIGMGHPKQGEPAMHGNAFTVEEMEIVKKFHNWENKPFTVLTEVQELWNKKFVTRGKNKYDEWNTMINKYKNEYPDKFNEIFGESKLENNDFKELLHDNKEATRNSSQKVFKKIQKIQKNLFGGSADLVAATKIQGFDGDFTGKTPAGNNILFGVREFAMGAIVNGISLYGCLKGFGSTFVVFSDYLKNSLRMAALQEISSLFLLTHDSIAAGYDGPTHQPIEQLIGFRATPNLLTFRPADMKETIGSYTYAYNQTNRPSILLFCRQDVPQYKNTCWNKTQQGAYIILQEEINIKMDAIIIATGSEVEYAINFANESQKNIRVVSMPCTELFDEQSEEYKNSIIPDNFEKIITIEASSELGWHKYAGKKGLIISANKFGASGHGDDVLNIQGFSKEKINKTINEYLK